MGVPKSGGILIVADHASNHVPQNIDLKLRAEVLETHIAWDIGVYAVSHLIAQKLDCAAIVGANSRLVVDLNRYEDEDALVPIYSDGIEILGNKLSLEKRGERIKLYYRSYHEKLQSILIKNTPALILSLHSFTPQLLSKPNELRPWHVGVLYNEDSNAATLAIPLLEEYGLNVGDQLPYSGKDLNATMNRHAEGNRIPYLGVEIRQDLVSDDAGQARFAEILSDICHKITEKLGEAA